MFLVGSANEELRAMTDSPSIRDRRLRIISGNPCARYASAASALILSNGKTATVRARADCRSFEKRILRNRLSAHGVTSIRLTHTYDDRENYRQ